MRNMKLEINSFLLSTGLTFLNKALKYYIASSRTEHPMCNEKRLTGLVTSCVGVVF
jgi:hypothetical protein